LSKHQISQYFLLRSVLATNSDDLLKTERGDLQYIA
jgi:hypothetical protein